MSSPPPESLGDQFLAYAIRFQIFLDKQWWGQYVVPAITILGSVVVFASAQRQISNAQKFNAEADKMLLASGSTPSSATATETRAKTKATPGPGTKGAVGSGGTRKRR